jgi:GNAT superfamily N-acetyltransferase
MGRYELVRALWVHRRRPGAPGAAAEQARPPACSRTNPWVAMSTAGRADNVIVREATEDDIPRMVELLVHGTLVEGKEDPTDLAPYRSALAEIARGPGAVLVAEVGGQLVGVCQLIVFRHLQSKGGLCAEVESVHVHPDYRGHGIGGVLMRAAVARARDLGCYRLQLTSNNARPEAHRFYERLGFEPSHRGFKLSL